MTAEEPKPGDGPDLGAAPEPIRPGDSFRAAARAAMWPQVERLLAVEPALRDPSAVDELKRYRVATRRLRAAFRVFDGALPKRAVKDVQPELAELARAVGAVRDLDVRIGGLPADEAVQPIRDAWAAERAEAATRMEHRLSTRRHGRLLSDLAALVRVDDDDPPRTRAGGQIGDRAGSSVWAGFERHRAGVRDLDDTDLEALHDVRIGAKRLRYALEFLAPVLGTDREWLVARLVELQDHLGALHDADLAGGAARTFLTDHGAELTHSEATAIRAYADAQQGTVDRLLQETANVAEPTVSDAFARRLSKAILGPEAATKAAKAAKPPKP